MLLSGSAERMKAIRVPSGESVGQNAFWVASIFRRVAS